MWKLRAVVLIVLVIPTSALNQAQTNASPVAVPVSTTPATGSGVRTDGLYQSSGKDVARFLRFYDDGTVVSASTAPNSRAQEVARWLNRGADTKGRFTVNGSNITFQTSNIRADYDYRGTISGDVLKLESEGHLRGRPAGRKYTEEYSFVPLAAEFFAEKTLKAFDPTVTLGLNRPSGVVRATARLGQSGPGNECPFTPLETAEYPAGTTHIAYEMTLDPIPGDSPHISVDTGAVCSKSSHVRNRCDRYTMIDGRRVKSSWVEVLHCGDGGPFRAGNYKLWLFFGGVPMKELTFLVK